VKKVYLSLGSNLGDREQMLQEAVDLLEASGLHIRRVSSVFETEPRDNPTQPWFLNLVIEAETALLPMQLLARVQKVERQLGRRRVAWRGPRTIDVDILLYERSVIETPQLTVPHPRMTERRFVLEPLAELASDFRHPVARRTVRELLSDVSGQTARRVEFRPAIPGR
jgi:2-amino-4-hydroxy-6-hydroxymethyldihydropteridine diphosphokinase